VEARIEQADCLEWLRAQESDSVDLILCSPPYEAARTYGIDFNLKGQDWVDWAVERYLECVRVSRGIVAWVVEGQTRQFRYSATPALLMADLHRAGVKLRKPPIFHRVGIPGSGGPDWWRNDYEFIVCASKGKLPWSDNTAMGHPPKWAPGGEMSYRLTDGSKVNQWGHPSKTGGTRNKDGKIRTGVARPSHQTITKKTAAEKLANGAKSHTKNDGDGMREQVYLPPSLANPGNVIKCQVGGGLMGSKLSHDNEAPFPESLATFFVLSFCPPDGTVCDIFSGSGTTAAVALKHNRNFIGCDIRESQVELTKRRIAEVQPLLI
jgi:hypothetical protein